MSLIAWIVAPAWIVSGVVIYQLYSKSRAITGEHEIVVLEEEKIQPPQGTRVMVSVANPRNALQLVRNTYKVCDAKNAHVELLHMVPVPDQVPLADAEKYMSAGREGIMEAMLYLENFFTISTTLRYCRNIARGIVSAVRQKKVDMLILGWHGRPRHQLFSLGSTIDPIIERSPCNVVIFKDCGDKDFKNVLVPIGGGRNSLFAMEIASILVDKDVGEMTALSIDTGKHLFDAEEFVKTNLDMFHIPPQRIHVKTVENHHVADAIINEADEYDLVVLGTTRESMIYQISHQTVPERVARECDKPLVVVKASGGIRSWIKRWF
jgi:nucleotide-binding universal stress UspA family protein